MPRLLRRAAVPVLLLLLLALYAWHGGGQDGGRLIDAEGRRVLVADGDTFRIWGDTIRLAGIDAVERTQFCMDERGNAWSCGQSAREALEQLVAKGGLRCIAIEQDRYGRTVARCTGKDGDIGAGMTSLGWAISTGTAYTRQEQAARDAKRGIWAGTFEVPSVWRERNRIEPKDARSAP
ncbi:MAG TPA: thermonuclease family protein [Sphingobium sp.]|uniref:thermonuclease family protein n=1 Tax=Sphingobium sp. TaxID=1912891 RepID=UPI002ED1AAFF